MCLIEVWTFSECGCRFDHHVPCHPSFSRQSSPTKARHGKIQPLPRTPPPSRTADDGDYAWSSYAEWYGKDGARQCSIRHIEHRAFREPICDDCLLEELGLKKGVGPIYESMENGLDGSEWLLESKVEIRIDQDGVNPEDLADDMPTPRVGTGFDSLGDGDADDEGGIDETFRSCSARRSAIDINRAQLGMANSWSSWYLKPLSEQRSGEPHERREMARPIVREVNDREVKSLAERAKRSLRLTIDRAKSTASKARSDTSWSPTKKGCGSESSSIHTPTLMTRVRSVVELRGRRGIHATRTHENRASVQGSATISPEGLTAPPDCHKPAVNCWQRVGSVVPRFPEQGEDAEVATPTSISSSAVYEIGQTSPTKWEDHLRQDLGEKVTSMAEFAPLTAGNKSELHFDADTEGRRLFSTTTTQSSVQPWSNTSSGNWVGLLEGLRLDEELAGNELDYHDEHRRLLSTIPDTSSSTCPVLTRQVSTTDMDASIPFPVKPYHAHRPSKSSFSSFTTAFSTSPQTSPPRHSPRMRQNLSFPPLATMLQIATSERPNWSRRDSSSESPPLKSPYRLGLEASPMLRSPAKALICVHECECCAICGCGIGERRVLSCVCGENSGEGDGHECRAEKSLVKKVAGMEVCDTCSGQQ